MARRLHFMFDFRARWFVEYFALQLYCVNILRSLQSLRKNSIRFCVREINWPTGRFPLKTSKNFINFFGLTQSMTT